jgi:ribosomal protein L40E
MILSDVSAEARNFTVENYCFHCGARGSLEQNQCKRALEKSLNGGFYFHPIEQRSLAGGPGQEKATCRMCHWV